MMSDIYAVFKVKIHLQANGLMKKEIRKER